MGLAIPDRRGWLGDAHAASPPIPPFPDFTVFEQDALRALGGFFGPDAAAFHAQVEAARVIDRVNTAIGFYTRVEVMGEDIVPLQLRLRGGHFEVEGLSLGVGVRLSAKGGRLETIEAVAYGESPFERMDLANLKLVRLLQAL